MEHEREFKFLLDKIKRNRSIDFSQYRPQVLKRRIVHRLHQTGCGTYWDYILLLNRDPREYDRLIDTGYWMLVSGCLILDTGNWKSGIQRL